MKNVLELLERTAARLPRQTAFADQQCSYDYQTVVNIAGSVAVRWPRMETGIARWRC